MSRTGNFFVLEVYKPSSGTPQTRHKITISETLVRFLASGVRDEETCQRIPLKKKILGILAFPNLDAHEKKIANANWSKNFSRPNAP